jgi:GT2 family glycosyltransferase/glycosyltransferase involved in cell wall biosynthesis
MSTSDANSFLGSPVSRTPERGEIALSAIICTYNRYGLLPEAIDSLIKQDIPAGLLEIIVVDNSPDQARAARFGQRYAGLSNLAYIVEPKPGLSNARNIGTAAALGRIAAFIDDDARACQTWAKELLNAHAAFDGRAGIVGGPIVPRWTDEKPAWLGKPLLGYLSLIDLGHELRELSAGEWLAGCNISFDRESLIAAGGFSTRLGRTGSGSTLLSNEEVEVSERVRAMGKLAIYAPKAVVEHVIPPERLTQSWFRRRAAWQAVSDLLSEPELAPALAEIASRRLSRMSHGSQLFGASRSAAALKWDMDLVYSLAIVALCGGVEPEQSRVGAGVARTGLVDKIGQLFHRRVASRSTDQIDRPNIPALALSAQELRHLYSRIHRPRKAGAIIVAPPWPNTGSSNIFSAQAAAHKEFGHESLLVLGPLYVSPRNYDEINQLKTEMQYDGISNVVYGMTYDKKRPYLSKSFVDWIFAGRDDCLSIDARYAARSRWRASISDFIDNHEVNVIHVNHAFEMLLAIRIRELIFRRTGRTPRLICDTHDVQAKAYAKRGSENPFNGRQDKYAQLLESELSLCRSADVLVHCSNHDKAFFERELPLIRHQLVVPCLDPQHEKSLSRIRGHNYENQFDFLYVGNNNFANFIAVKWLLTEVWPLLNGHPRLAIVGRIKESVRQMDRSLYEKHKHYFVGSVPDIGVYYSASAAVLAPSLVGTGCSIKFIEALCAGKTVIATADSLRGLPDHIQERCAEFVQDTPRQFAEAMMMTLARRPGNEYKTGSIYDDHFHSKHYMTKMKDLFTGILQ